MKLNRVNELIRYGLIFVISRETNNSKKMIKRNYFRLQHVIIKEYQSLDLLTGLIFRAQKL